MEKEEIDIFRHRLVPKHEILSEEEEKKRIIESYGGNQYVFPTILSSDPAVKILEAKPGDLLRITRKSPTGYRSIYYRLVTEEIKK